MAELAPPLVKLLAISGSLRKASVNTKILETLADSDSLNADAVIDVIVLNDVPLYNEDLDSEVPPPAVQALRDSIRFADGVIISTPEYNHGLPGVLKNALDWASRPHGQSCLAGKPVLSLSASPAFTGGVRAQAQLNETLIAVGAQLVPRPQIVIGGASEQVSATRLMNEATLSFVVDGVRDLLRLIERNQYARNLES